jgi:hypothetical protein
MIYINAFLQRFVYGNTVAGQVLYSMDRIEDSTMCYNRVMLRRDNLAVFLITMIIKHTGTYINVDRMSRKKSFSGISLVKR